jgi:hypothetical protein
MCHSYKRIWQSEEYIGLKGTNLVISNLKSASVHEFAGPALLQLRRSDCNKSAGAGQKLFKGNWSFVALPTHTEAHCP